MDLQKYQKYFSNSHILTELLNENKLNRMIEIFDNCLVDIFFLGSGGDATGFIYKQDPTQVLKICTKRIRFFKGFDTYDATEFLRLSRKIKYFVPINKILYEDDYVFVYLQALCEPIKTTVTKNKMRTALLRATKCMIENGIMTKLSRHNLAIWKDRIYVFDYHGLNKIKMKHDTITEEWFRNVLITNSLYFLTNLPKYNKIKLAWKKNHNEKDFYEYIKDKEYIPKCYIKLVKCIIHDKIEINEINKYLDECIDILVNNS